MNARMSRLVTRPEMPVPFTRETSTRCSWRCVAPAERFASADSLHPRVPQRSVSWERLPAQEQAPRVPECRLQQRERRCCLHRRRSNCRCGGSRSRCRRDGLRTDGRNDGNDEVDGNGLAFARPDFWSTRRQPARESPHRPLPSRSSRGSSRT